MKGKTIHLLFFTSPERAVRREKRSRNSCNFSIFAAIYNFKVLLYVLRKRLHLQSDLSFYISEPLYMFKRLDKSKLTKNILITSAVCIAVASLVYSHFLARDLLKEEHAKMEVWAEAMRSLTAANESTDLNLVLKIINSNNTIPVIVTDSHDNIFATRNLNPEPAGNDSLQVLGEIARRMVRHGECMRMDLTAADGGEGDFIKVYYEESVLLKRLTIYPYVQLTIVAIFLFIALFALLASKRAERNRIWVGLSRETAHQLGTPISSLMAWSEVFRCTYPDDELIPEMDKDIRRLQLIAERFSKIGSQPESKSEDLRDLITSVVEYIDRRTSKKVEIRYVRPEAPVFACVNALLFEWVVENICKNAVDAMKGEGLIEIQLAATAQGATVEIRDTGKGIARKNFKRVFNPGFTTKKRGWGLGLSLAKRIIEEYHKGHIYIKDSEINKGTTFMIEIG